MTFNRSAILRDAHARTARRMAPFPMRRPGDRFDATVNAWVPEAGYRFHFAGCLRAAWAYAKAMGRHVTVATAELVLSLADNRRVVDLMIEVQFAPYTRAGNERRRTLLDEVDLDALGGVPGGEVVETVVHAEEVGADAGAGFEGGGVTHGVLLVLVRVKAAGRPATRRGGRTRRRRGRAPRR